MENKKEKNNNLFLIAIIVVLVLLCPLCFILGKNFTMSDNKVNDNGSINNNNISNGDESNNQQDNEDSNLIYKDSNFEVTYKKDEEYVSFPNVFLNGHLILKNTCGVNKTTVINNKYIIITSGCETGISSIYDKSAKTHFEQDDFRLHYAVYENGMLTINYQNKDNKYMYIGDYEGSLCKNSDTKVVVNKIVKYDMNNGEKIISTTEENVDDIVKRRYDVTCEELKKSNDPKLAYQKELATSN